MESISSLISEAAKVAPRALRISATKHAVPNPLDLQLARSRVQKVPIRKSNVGMSKWHSVFFILRGKRDLPRLASQLSKRATAQITEQSRVDKLAYQRGGEGCSASVAHRRNKARSAKSFGFAARKEYNLQKWSR